MDAIFLIIRLVMGFGVAARGARKLFGWFGGGGIKGTGAYFETLGFRPGTRFAAVAGSGEFFGGLLMALGLLNPIGPALITSVMLVAIRTVHKGHGFFTENKGRELPVLYMTGAVAVACADPGLFSLDYILDVDWAFLQLVLWLVSALCIVGALGILAMRRSPEAPAAPSAITPDFVLSIFRRLENGGGVAFFDHVADDVDWTVMGTHPLAGHYPSKKSFIAATFAVLGQVLPNGAELHTEHVIVKDNQAAVELHCLATASNGMRFDNRYCWVVDFREGLIVRVRAYLDSATVSRLFRENPTRDLVSVP